MAQGLEIFGADGSLFVSIGDRLARFLGAVTTAAGVNGSAADARLAQGQPFFLAIGGGGYQYLPLIAIDNAAVSWTYSAPGAGSTPGSVEDYGPAAVQIIYGVF